MQVADKVNSVSVFLINKRDFAKYKELVVDSLATKPIMIDDGELFYKTSGKDYYPSWVDGFFGANKLGENKKKLSSKTLSAVFFTSIKINGQKVTFGVAFGNGRYLIRKEYIQHDFGLITSRHAIDSTRINSIRTTTYDGSIKDKIVRSLADIKQSEFFLNANTDALVAVSGKVRSEKTGDLVKNRNIGGRDSVSMTAYVDVNNLKDFLKQIYEQYISDGQDGVRYESNIKELNQEEDIKIAEGLLQKVIDNRKQEENLYLNLPIEELGEMDKVTGYTIDGKDYEELTIEILDNYPTIEKLQNSIVGINWVDDEEWTIEYRLYDFLYAEFEQDAKCYILASGDFYRISKNYKKRVDEFYMGVRTEDFPYLKAWEGEAEGKFNKDQKMDNVLVMDEKFVFPENRDRFEVCDLLTADKHFIHVKKFDIASQPLGHLFNQGMLSAQCIADDEIRPLVQDKIKKVQSKEHKDCDFSILPGFKPKDYTVTFLLLCSSNTKMYDKNHPKIPFMARAVFHEQYSVITGLGFKVSLASMFH